MKYGFIIDNRKCIGCHACTTACKAEHQVPVGVNRTWVKQIEKGQFPNTRRLFSVMRCNHCTDAPCVDICPVEALFVREDGIVDFNKKRCIGCKSCMQACPYDALYIDPDTNTAAKCNYCAHRIDIGLEPACVNVCPEQAIISGDMDNADSEIAQLLSRQQVKVRKPEKATVPNLFYIDADEASLNPAMTSKSDSYFWSSQSFGVGHYAKEAEKLAFANEDVLATLMQNDRFQKNNGSGGMKSVEILMGKAQCTYDVPDKGILWGWEVSRAYILTKAIAAGLFLVAFIAQTFGWFAPDNKIWWWTIGLGMFFMMLTGLFLVKDLDRPDRFINVLLRPQWKSWLVKGGYAISIFGGLLVLFGVSVWFDILVLKEITQWLTALTAIVVAVYTAFLFAQAKGRDFWQSPTMSIHMLVHSMMAGSAVFMLLEWMLRTDIAWSRYLGILAMISIAVNLFTIFLELATTHPTKDAKTTVEMILSGRYKNLFWVGAIMIGNILPFGILFFTSGNLSFMSVASICILIGIYITDHIWVEAPQRISLS